MYTSTLLTPSKDSTLVRTESTSNTFSPKRTNISQSLGSIILEAYRMFPEILQIYVH
jgi:hypothetical protein